MDKGPAAGSSTIFYGETHCQAKHASGNKANQPCTNKGYYRQGGRVLCGVHSSIKQRVKLEKNPNAGQLREQRLAQHQVSVDAATAANHQAGRRGEVCCSKMAMMRSPADIPGYLKVFPNHKHQNRKDGFGCASLSPMNLGPVDHGQKGLPKAKLLENYHQYNKVYNAELNDGAPTQTFYSEQLSGYKSGTGQRRKYTSKSKIASRVAKLRTMFSIHRDATGTEQRYNYVQSRYFYCHFYERLVAGNPDLARLRAMLAAGTNLQIVGYDGFPVSRPLAALYEDTARPYGHELVLYTLLTATDPAHYPWNEYYERHAEIYPTLMCPDYLRTKGTTDDDGERDGQQGPRDKVEPSEREQSDSDEH